MHGGRHHLLSCKKSNILTRRDNRNTTDERQGHSSTNERIKTHRDGRSHNSTESQAPKNETSSQSNSSEKSHNEHSQAASMRSDNQTDWVDRSKQQTGNSASNHTSKDVDSAGSESDNSAWASSSSPPSNSPNSSSNSSDSSSILTSKIKEFLHSNQTVSDQTGNNNFTWSSSPNFPATTSFANSSSLEQHNVEQNSPGTHHYKTKVWCIGIGCLIAFVCIVTAMVFAKKRLKLKGPAVFFRRRFRSNSNDSNRAVRDRRSIGPHFRTSDPFSSPSTFSRKPLVLRPESISHIRSSSPRRPSVLHLGPQNLKSQISPPIIEPPSPADYQPLSGGSPDKSRRSVSSSSNQPSSQFNVCPPSYYEPRKYPPSLPKRRPSVSLTRDSGIRRGSAFPIKAYDPLTERTPVPPRPPRPDFALLPCSSVGTNGLPQSIHEVEPFPSVLPLKVARRSQYSNKYHRRHNSIDQVILDPPASYAYQDSPTLPQFTGQERSSVLSMARGADPARASNLSRSTCYSQTSEQENGSIPEENPNLDSENHHTPLRFMSFGTSRSSSKLEQQLDSFISKNM